MSSPISIDDNAENVSNETAVSPSVAMLDARDAKLAYMQQRTYRNDATSEHFSALEAELKHRSDTDKLFGEVFAHHDDPEVTLVAVPTDFECLRDLYYTFEEYCKPFEDYSLKYVKHFVHMCETESQSQI